MNLLAILVPVTASVEPAQAEPPALMDHAAGDALAGVKPLTALYHTTLAGLMGREAMTMTDFSQLVHKWFDAAGQADGPLLPDGWFGGRPHENIYLLEHVDSLENSLVIHLSDDTTLRFDGPGRVFVENSDLVFDGFRQATLRWKHYGGGEEAPYHERSYEEGQVRLAAPIGTKIKIP